MPKYHFFPFQSEAFPAHEICPQLPSCDSRAIGNACQSPCANTFACRCRQWSSFTAQFINIQALGKPWAEEGRNDTSGPSDCIGKDVLRGRLTELYLEHGSSDETNGETNGSGKWNVWSRLVVPPELFKGQFTLERTQMGTPSIMMP